MHAAEAFELESNPFDDDVWFPPEEHPVAPKPKVDLPEPDAFQQRVIDARDRSIRVIAPAGAGKTQTLVRRVMQRIEEGIAPRRILVLTFDRNAKRSFEGMIQRMGMRMSPDVRTLNAFGWDVLKRHFPDERFDLVKTWQIHGSRGIAPERSKHLLIRSLAELGEAKDLTKIFDALKDHLFDPRDRAYKERNAWLAANYRRLVPDDFWRRYGDRYAEEFASAVSDEFRNYERFLHDRKVIDYQDQKLRTLKLLEGDAAQRDLIQKRYDEVIVDEVQDINPLDAELIKTIAGRSTLVLTGDDDQAIYEFRWASPRFLIDPNGFFARDFTTFELSLNYRCPPQILAHALPLIAHNNERIPKQPTAFKPDGGEVVLNSSPNDLAEARQILTWIEKMREDARDLRYHDFAVLYRVNAQHYLIQTELFRNRIPYTVNERFDLRIIWRKALTLLELSTKLRGGEPLLPEDRRQALELYPSFSGLRPPDLNWIVAAGKDNEKFPGTGTHAAISERLSAGAATYFRSAIRALTTARTLREELEVIGSRFLGFTEQGEEAIDESPIEKLQEFAQKMNVPRDQFIQRFGRFLYSSTIAKGDADDRGVELSTCHGAKGREWKAVILPSCNQGKFPDFRSTQNPQDLEAERRLFYVSMTRASQRLYISYLAPDPNPQTEKSRTKLQEPSDFLYEADLLKNRPVRVIQETAPLPFDAAMERRAKTTKGNSRYAEKSSGRSAKAPVRSSVKSTSERAGGRSRGGGAGDRTGFAAKSGGGGSAAARGEYREANSRPVALSTIPAEELLPPLVVAVPGANKRKMTFPRDGDVRRFVTELIDSPVKQRLPEVVVEYEHPESTFALQLGLIVRGVPYQIAVDHRLLESSSFASVYRTLTSAEPGFLRTDHAHQPTPSTYKGLSVVTLVRAAREFGISIGKGADVLNDAISHAVRVNGDGDARGVRFALHDK
jgi:DNA helicase-2/ATP-dependent DNA helicase PcrA